MPHNHAPHCCCYVARNEGNPQATRCPICVEHGELANLNTPANTPAQPAECPSCHAIGHQPHTDYCQARIIKDADHPGDWTDTIVTSQPASTTSQPIPTCPCQTRLLGDPGIRHHPLCQWHPNNRTLPPQ